MLRIQAASVQNQVKEDAEEDAVRDAFFPCSYSCLWGRQFAMLAYVPDLKSIIMHACLLLFWCFRGGGCNKKCVGPVFCWTCTG